MRQGLTGIAVFIVALVAAVGITKYYGSRQVAPNPPATRAGVGAVAPPPPEVNSSEVDVSYKVRFVTLDFATRKSFTTLELERDQSRPAPEKLWVGTCFQPTLSEHGEVTSQCLTVEPAEISHPFAGGDKVTITAPASCLWCKQYEGATARNFYASVNVSTVSSGAARLLNSQVKNEANANVPVVVQNTRAKNR